MTLTAAIAIVTRNGAFRHSEDHHQQYRDHCERDPPDQPDRHRPARSPAARSPPPAAVERSAGHSGARAAAASPVHRSPDRRPDRVRRSPDGHRLPSKAPAAVAHHGAQTSVVPSVTNEGSAPNATAYGSQEIAGRLQPEVVRPGAGDEEQMHQPGRDPVGERERDRDDQHDPGADGERTATHQSTHHGLVLTVHNGVAGGINRVIAPADREVAGEDRCCDEQTPGRTSSGRPGHGRDQCGDGNRRPWVAGERQTACTSAECSPT